MFTNDEPISLKNLGGGAAIERFDDELSRVLDNVMDPNTDAEKVREVTLKVKIKPTKDRDMGAVSIEVNGKIASPSGYPTQIFIGRDSLTGMVEAYESNPKQGKLFDRPDPENLARPEFQKAGGDA